MDTERQVSCEGLLPEVVAGGRREEGKGGGGGEEDLLEANS